MKRRTVLAGAITAGVVLALGGGYAYSVATDRPLVGTAAAAIAPLNVTVSASGALEPARTAGVYPASAGTLTKVRVEDGDAVTAGQSLALIAKGPLRLAVAQARAAFTSARAQSQAVENGVPAAIERSAAKAALAAARSQVSAASRNYRAFRADYADATKAERKAMRPTLRTLRTAKASANAALKAAQAGLKQLSAASRVSLARKAATRTVTATERALAIARDNLRAAELVAPFAGTVSFVGTVEKGSGVTPGMAVFSVVDPGRLEFEAAVNETDISQVEAGQAATVILDAFDTAFTGTVDSLRARPETTSTGAVAFGVRVSFDGGQARLLEGMSGSTDIVVESIPDALVVPIESVLTRGDARTVFVLGADDVVQSRVVRIGASTDTEVQVLEGVTAGDRVVTTGASALGEGQQVRTK